MYDPPSGAISDPPEEPSRSSRNVCLWVAIALSGLSLLLVCSVGGLLAIVYMNFPQIGDASPFDGVPALEVDPTPQRESPSNEQDLLVDPDCVLPESPRAADETVPLGPVLINENFDEPTTRWDQSLNRVVDRTYELRVDTPNYDSYGLFLGEGFVSNFDMAVDVQQVTGSPIAEYGIRFRQSGPGDYLMFSISGSGCYRLVRVSNNIYESVVPWTFDDRIATEPDAVNRLRVTAQDRSIRAFINDREVIDTIDEVGAFGQLTLGITTFDEGGLAVRFDNLEGQAEGIDLAEDFSEPEATAWSIGGATIKDGTYELFAGGGIQMWQQPLPQGSSEVENFVLDVDATFTSGPEEDVAYGVMFGDGGLFDFYSLLLSTEGTIRLTVSDGNGGVLELIEPTELAAINTGIGATNAIRVEVNDNIIAITINDEQLPDVESPILVSGEVGMIVSSGDASSIQVRFDDFRLRETTGEQRQA